MYVTTKNETLRLRKLARFQRLIESQVMLTDSKDDLKLLAALYLTTAKRIFVTIEGFTKSKAVLLKYIQEMEPDS